MGNRYLRKLLVVGAHAVLYNRKGHPDGLRTWASKLMETKPFKLVAVALANQLARIASRSCATKRNRRSFKASRGMPPVERGGGSGLGVMSSALSVPVAPVISAGAPIAAAAWRQVNMDHASLRQDAAAARIARSAASNIGTL